ncbi:phosphonate C-P lyase system protein PhnH [Acidocella sp.]|uniref:phosphonate C-P lyase system protein PhnH n=1 Tax=Acidocella sp. TaxID=50710 RepID=UPI003CFCB6C3
MRDLSPGFGSPLEAQACFRAVLSAFSRPGHRVALPVPPAVAPPGLSRACAALLLTLADAQTRVALDEAHPARDWLVFHSGARLTGARDADFHVSATRPALATLRQGSDEVPEDGATLILDLPAFAPGRAMRLSGPGLKEETTTALPLDDGFVQEWRVQSRAAPRGVDVVLCAGMEMVALPRSLRIEEG